MPLHPNYRFFCRSIFSLFFLATINAGIPQAQITPDGTLPTSVQELENMKKITGGKQVGNNLFHSFEKFSIPTGTEAIFENAPDIQNIFTRITGGEASFIDGLLQTQGGANFFLINPNGIVFGENARLDVGGSFIATTANSVEFADGTSFDARSNNPNVTLTWDAPIGLGLDGNNGSITVNGSGNQIISNSNLSPIEFRRTPSGISANDGQTLALVGNGINFNGGVITTEGGQVYLTSVESGSVGISQAENELTLIESDVIKYQNINLSQQSLIDGSGEKIGTVSVIGKNINLSDASFILVQNQGNFLGGSIDIKANESITLAGNSPDGNISSSIRSEVIQDGSTKGADIDISAGQLRLQDGSKIITNTFSNNSEALGGNLNIEVANSIEVVNSNMLSLTLGKGDAGNINLSTSQLQLIDVGVLTSSTFGKGDGGEVSIDSDLIEVIGGSSTSTSRANISASSFGSGNAGTLTINTEQLRVKDGGAVSSSSASMGNAGSLIINASESIEVSGIDQNFQGSNNPESTIRSAVQAASLGG